MGTDNTTLARRYMTEVWGKGNLAAIDELVDKDVVVSDTMGTDLRGIEKVKQMVDMMKTTFSDNTFTIEEIIVAGDRVVIRHTWQGVHRGDFFGIPGTGRTVKNPGIDVLRIANGKVVEDIGYMDSYAMFQQLGALPDRDKLVQPRPAAEAQPTRQP